MTEPTNTVARLLITCPDKPGIVAAVCGFLFSHSANITSLDQHSTDPEGGVFLHAPGVPDALPGHAQGGPGARLQAGGGGPVRNGLAAHLRRGREKTGPAGLQDRPLPSGTTLAFGQGGTSLRSHHGHQQPHRPAQARGRPGNPLPPRAGCPRRPSPRPKPKCWNCSGTRPTALCWRGTCRFSPPDSWTITKTGSSTSTTPSCPPSPEPTPTGKPTNEASSSSAPRPTSSPGSWTQAPSSPRTSSTSLHRNTVQDLKILGQDIERQVLVRAVKWHLEDRIIVFGNKTIVFSL